MPVLCRVRDNEIKKYDALSLIVWLRTVTNVNIAVWRLKVLLWVLRFSTFIILCMLIGHIRRFLKVLNAGRKMILEGLIHQLSYPLFITIKLSKRVNFYYVFSSREHNAVRIIRIEIRAFSEHMIKSDFVY